MSNVYLEKIADAVPPTLPASNSSGPTYPQKTSTGKTFIASEGIGITAGLAGGLVGGRMGSTRMGKLLAAKPLAQAIGKKLFGREAVITGTHLGSEVGAHILGGVGAYGAMEGVAAYDNHKHNKYLQKAAGLVSTH